jgi:hypothetical protein
MTMLNPRLGTLMLMILGAAATRLLPHPPNMTSITALALFGGAQFADRRLAFVVPLLALALSNLVLGVYWNWSVMAWQPHMWVQYAAFALVVVLGMALRRRQSIMGVFGATLAAATLFFVLTNFAEWAFQPWYPKTVAGLVACFVAAVPFFGNALLGDLFYSAMLFGAWHWLEHRFTALRATAAVAA